MILTSYERVIGDLSILLHDQWAENILGFDSAMPDQFQGLREVACF
jgi:hypothetical protein